MGGSSAIKIIAKAQEIPAGLWGSPRPKETDYRLLQYLLRTECEEGTLLHNAVTGELVLLCAEEQTLLDTLPAPHTAAMDELIAAHFLVPVTFDEKKSVAQLRALMRTMHRETAITGYTILPTTCCNARCFYCYEADYPHISMTEETADRLIGFIDAHHGGKRVGLSWFGGEPTLGVHIIDRICRAMQAREIEYSSSMVSNGYLFDGALAEKAKTLWKLNSIQITLDGTEAVYNKVKSYVSAEGSPYRRVLENIGLLLAQDIRVSVRMNLDRHNADDLSALIGELAEHFAEQKLFSAYVWPLFDDCGFQPVAHTQEDRAWLEQRAADLNRLIGETQLGYSKKSGLPSIARNHCMADSDTSVIINPDGTFSKCEHCCCTENVGNLAEGFTDTARLSAWKQTVEYPDCAACPLLPVCVELKNCFSCTGCDRAKREQEIQTYKKTMYAAWKACSDRTGERAYE